MVLYWYSMSRRARSWPCIVSGPQSPKRGVYVVERYEWYDVVEDLGL